MNYNIELIMPSPVYMTTANMLIPMFTISRKFIIELAIKITYLIKNLFFSFRDLIVSSSRNIIQHLSNPSNHLDLKFLIIGLLLSGTLFLVGHIFEIVLKQKRNRVSLETRIAELERKIYCLQYEENIRKFDYEVMQQNQTQIFKQTQINNKNKFKQYNKQIKKMINELKIYI